MTDFINNKLTTYIDKVVKEFRLKTTNPEIHLEKEEVECLLHQCSGRIFGAIELAAMVLRKEGDDYKAMKDGAINELLRIAVPYTISPKIIEKRSQN